METAALTILLDYQVRIQLTNLIFDSLFTRDADTNSVDKHIWIKKATGLGISEFMLRFMAWFCIKDNALSGSQMCIVTGPRIDLAIALIDRMRINSLFMYLISKLSFIIIHILIIIIIIILLPIQDNVHKLQHLTQHFQD